MIARAIVLIIGIIFFLNTSAEGKTVNKPFSGVCPPFFLRDEQGQIINPVRNENTTVPYSPKQTCGLADCHNYDKITRGYHFQQGKDEKPGQKLKDLYQWVLNPGQYGGRW